MATLKEMNISDFTVSNLVAEICGAVELNRGRGVMEVHTVKSKFFFIMLKYSYMYIFKKSYVLETLYVKRTYIKMVCFHFMVEVL